MSDPLIGKTFGDYEIIELLGRGGMASVYRGHDARLARDAAVKITDAEAIEADMREEYDMRFSREARAIAHLTHPNIVGVYQFGQVEELNFMAMHFIKGEDLRCILGDLAEWGEAMSEKQIYSIIQDVASALDYAHQHGVIHRDIKPSNIMVTPQGPAILTDFGLALNTIEGTLGNTFGSAHYIAPEQAISSAQSVPQSDFYSLGVVLYEMVTGKVPFDDPSTMSVALKHLNEPPPLPSSVNPAITPALEDVIMRILRKSPEDRYPNGAALSEALGKALGITPSGNGTYDDEDTAEIPVVKPTEVQAPTIPKPTNIIARPASHSEQEKAPTLAYALEQENSPAVSQKPRRRSALPLILLLIVIIAGGFGAWQAGLFESLLGDEPQSTTVLTQATATESDRQVIAGTPAPTTTHTLVPTATFTDEPTDSPTPTETPIPPTASSSTQPSEAAVHLLMVWDEDSVQFINATNRYVNLLPLMFRRYENGREIFFKMEDLQGSLEAPSALGINNCYQIWRNDLSQASPPATVPACAHRVGYRIVSDARWFWINDTPGATFEVTAILQQGVQVLTTCAIEDKICEISLPYED